MSKFVILHLSDSHIGHPKRKTNWHSVLEPFLSDLTSFSSKHGLSPSLIAFTGDLAYGRVSNSKLPKQYRAATEFLARVREACRAPDAPLLLIPGNHDVNWQRISPDQISHVGRLTPENARDLMQNAVGWKRFLERLNEWRRFASTQLPSNWTLDENLTVTGSFDYAGVRVGVAGFNTAWACHQHNTKGNIWLGALQLERADEALRDTEFRIAATHHPLSWLSDYEEPSVREHIQAKYSVYLHGHQHAQWFQDSRGHLDVYAGALYQGSDKPNTYSWIVIDFSARTAQLSLRTYTQKAGGGWIPLALPRFELHGDWYQVNKLFEGAPLRLLTAAPSAAAASLPQPEKPHLAGLSPRASKPDLAHAEALLDLLSDEFHCSWEPNSYRNSETTVIYWPVRLRHPTPIHAVQAFVAAGLQKVGATVVLGLDDLGTVEAGEQLLLGRVSAWFTAVGANFQDVNVVRFKAQLGSSPGAAWTTVEAWLGRTEYRIGRVLKIAKLTQADEQGLTPDDVTQKRPRRLLSPAMVWAVLELIARQHQCKSVVTLGGYDERDLWLAWRECIHNSDHNAGHLFIPELKSADSAHPVHMAEQPSLRWESKSDIKGALEEALSSTNWSTAGQLIPWAINGCACIPKLVQVPTGADYHVFDSEGASAARDPQQYIIEVASELARYVLPRQEEKRT